MKKQFYYLGYALIAVSLLSITSCKKDTPAAPEKPQTAVSGVYILNEGDWTGDNASLSYFDLETNEMKNDVFYEVNSETVLGELANDMGIYGSKLFITVTGSNKVEILNATNGKILKTVNIEEPRYIAFYGKYAFISSYTNQVFVVDTASMSIHTKIEVGRTPEQLAVSGAQVFVANAGWKDAIAGGEYDNRVSVIDAENLVKVKDIEVADNIDRVYADNNGHVYVNSSTIYGVWPEELYPSRLYVIDTETNAVEQLPFGAGLMAIAGEKAYLASGNYQEGKTQLLEMNTATLLVKPLDILSGVDNLNGLATDPDSGDLWVSTYTNPGKVYRYKTTTKEMDTYTVGIFPKTFSFKR